MARNIAIVHVFRKASVRKLVPKHRQVARVEKVSREPSLTLSEFRSLYTALAGVLFVGGLGLAANWVSTVNVAPADRHLTIAGPLFYVGLGLIFLAFYVFAAAMSDSKRWWLPRKWAVLRTEGIKKMLEEFKLYAITILTEAHLVGVQLQKHETLDIDTATAWQNEVQTLVTNVWGTHQSSIIVFGGRNPDAYAYADEPVRDMALNQFVRPTMANLNAFIAIVHSVPISKDASFTDAQRSWLSFFTQLRKLTETVNKQVALRQQADGIVASPMTAADNP